MSVTRRPSGVVVASAVRALEQALVRHPQDLALLPGLLRLRIHPREW
jgi:hypothetical protein